MFRVAKLPAGLRRDPALKSDKLRHVISEHLYDYIHLSFR